MVRDSYYTSHGDHFISYMNVKSLCHASETNTILCANCALIKKNFTLQKKGKGKESQDKTRQDKTGRRGGEGKSGEEKGREERGGEGRKKKGGEGRE